MLASKGHVKVGLMIATLFGTGLIIASACVVNNYIDRQIDVKMARTKMRALAVGKITIRSALIYALVLGVLGFWTLATYTNWLTFWLGALAYIMYTLVYGLAKRRTIHGTLVGSISGALPPVAGYAAVTGRLDLGAVLVFLIYVVWQMPHFYAIAIYRLKDYRSAGIPVWPVIKGIRSTKIQIAGYIIAFVLANILITYYGYTGVVYILVMLIAGLYWLRLGVKGFKASSDTKWAKQCFKASLLIILVLDLMMSVGPILP